MMGTLSSINCLQSAHPPAIQCQVIDFANHRGSLWDEDQMSPILHITHQDQVRLSTTELPLSRTDHTPQQCFLRNIPAIYIVQDILEGRDVHFLTDQAVHTIRNDDITDIVFGKGDFKYYKTEQRSALFL